MTAIAGYWGLDRPADAPALFCRRMLDAQRVHAPDEPRVRSAGDVTLGRRLYRLLPEDEHDRGPVADAAGRLLVADVRIDNRGEVATALGIAAPSAGTLADAALLALALERWELDALHRVVGDFAFALWDDRAQRLVLARDFMGQRPLHYHRGDGVFAFASMPKGLHALPDIARAPDPAAVANFLALRAEAGSASFFKGIERVPPGHYVQVDRHAVSVHRYWHPPTAALRLPRTEDYAAALRGHLDIAVGARLRGSDGRLGAQLSGGLDSTAVTATAARQASDRPVVAYTAVPRAGFGVPANALHDEGAHAAAVAKLYPNIEHVLIAAGARSPLDAVDRNAFLYDRPVLNLCNGTWADAIREDARRRGLRVMLVGSAGNAGFSHDGMDRLPQLLGRGRLLALARLLWSLRGWVAPRTILSQTLGPFLPDAVTNAVARVRGRTLADYSLIAPAALHALPAPARRRRAVLGAARLDMIERVDYGNYNKGVLGGWGLDVRDPTADRRLIEFCLSVPSGQYLAGGVPRALARLAAADRLPTAILNERRKGYQGADWFEGLAPARAQLDAELAHIGRDAAARGLIDLARADALLTGWPGEDGWRDDAVTRAYRYALLRTVSVGHFLRTVAGTN